MRVDWMDTLRAVHKPFLNSIDDIVCPIGADVCDVVVGLVEIEQCQLSPEDFHRGLGL